MSGPDNNDESDWERCSNVSDEWIEVAGDPDSAKPHAKAASPLVIPTKPSSTGAPKLQQAITTSGHGNTCTLQDKQGLHTSNTSTETFNAFLPVRPFKPHTPAAPKPTRSSPSTTYIQPYPSWPTHGTVNMFELAKAAPPSPPLSNTSEPQQPKSKAPVSKADELYPCTVCSGYHYIEVCPFTAQHNEIYTDYARRYLGHGSPDPSRAHASDEPYMTTSAAAIRQEDQSWQYDLNPHSLESARKRMLLQTWSQRSRSPSPDPFGTKFQLPSIPCTAAQQVKLSGCSRVSAPTANPSMPAQDASGYYSYPNSREVARQRFLARCRAEQQAAEQRYTDLPQLKTYPKPLDTGLLLDAVTRDLEQVDKGKERARF